MDSKEELNINLTDFYSELDPSFTQSSSKGSGPLFREITNWLSASKGEQAISYNNTELLCVCV